MINRLYANAEPTVSTPESKEQPKKICVLGLGYIGLPTCAILTKHGYEVHGVDVQESVVQIINRGDIHIEEPGLGALVKTAVEKGLLTADTQPTEADVFFICVPTPFYQDKSPNLDYVRDAAKAIKPFLRKGNLIILESTSPPHTTTKVVSEEVIPPGWTVGEDVFVAHCPERVLPGQILRELIENDRVIGGMTDQCSQVAKHFYESFVQGQLHTTNATTAEVVKLVENTYRDINIAFANELASIAESLHFDVHEAIELANHHPRVNILSPGPGVGGHCISVDPWFLIHAAPEECQLIHTARQINDQKPTVLFKQIIKLIKDFNIQAVGCLGLTYKANVDDLRESPSLTIVKMLSESNSSDLYICDPLIPQERIPDIPLTSLETTIQNSELLVLLTDHKEFIDIPQHILKTKYVVDCRGSWRQHHRSVEKTVKTVITKQAA